MANPVIMDVPALQWTKIATAVTAGMVHNITTRNAIITLA